MKSAVTDTVGLKAVGSCPLLLILVLALQPVAAVAQGDSDPWIAFNRSMYGFNEGFDEILIKPVTQTYDALVPGFAKRGVTNFFNNLDDINVVFNDLLQLKMGPAMQDSGRFVLNSTVGVAGLFDVAAYMGLYKNEEDFGQTLGYWGAPSGPYLVLPFLGTITVRDAIGLGLDYLMNPVFWVDDKEARFALLALDNIDTRLYYMAAESMVTGDEYRFVRDAYLQRREYLVADGEVYDEWDDF
jgi:phospholipid-binding lipoprotein MlaA